MSPTQFFRFSSQDAECNISEAAKGCTAEKSPGTKLSNCWCKKSLANQLVDSLSVYPTIYKVLDIPGGAERDRGQLRPYPRVSCDPTRARGQLRPYPQEFYGRVNVFYLYQGSAATLPDLSVKNPTGFCSVSRSSRFKYSIPSINYSPPFWQHMLSMIDFSPLLATHAFNDSGSRTTFLCDPTWQHSFYHISSPPWQPMLSMIQVQVQHSFYQFFPPPPWQPMLCDPTWQHSFYQIFPPLGNPCFQWFEFNYNIPFINFPPLGNPCFATLPDNIPFIKFPPPLGNPCFQWFKFKYNIPFINFSPPPWQPMLCDPTWQHSFYQIFPPPLATHAFNDSTSSTTFLLSIFPPPPWQPMLCDPTWQHSPPLATHAFNDSSSSTTFLLSKIFPPLGNPCFATLPDNIPFIKFPPPPLATHAFNDSSSSTTFLLSIFSPPPWQPMLCDPTWQHSFYQIFHPLGNPFFQWFKFKYNIPFMKKIPPPLGKEQPEASQRHAKHQAYSSATPPNYFINQQCRTKIGPHNTPYSHT